MSNYLTKIIESKQEYLKSHQLEIREKPEPVRKKKLSFTERVRNKSTLGIIAEFKRSSPSLGVINHSVNPTVMAGNMSMAGQMGYLF